MKKSKPKTPRKKRFIIEQRKTAGQSPGKLIFIGEQKQENASIELIAYDEDNFIEIAINSVNELANYQNKYKNVWININGLHNIDLINDFGSYFNIHPLILEDIAHTDQTPKVEIDENYIFTIMKMLGLDKDSNQLNAEQVSMYLSKNILLTFQEKEGDLFEPIRNRIRNKKGRVRSFGLAYLKYSLLDSIVDNYLFLMETFGTRVEELEDQILLEPNENTLQEINSNKIELNYFRKAIRPAKDSILFFKNASTHLINSEEQLFYNDLIDLIKRAYDSVEQYKNMLSEQLAVYSINVNNRLNDIMKVLTIFSTIFIPLTFITSVYGTNFEYIPELKFHSAYFIMWGVIIITAFIMLGYFKFKKWF
ncbi:magnesium/cobalt transporter CorA [Tenacibaculum sp. TC6]|uniref:magnesium/cobalt transporter CorA n=1 Tax=Tenacibaculum sp. TC6 TaxID=3423223 RepID=UPI003D36616E